MKKTSVIFYVVVLFSVFSVGVVRSEVGISVKPFALTDQLPTNAVFRIMQDKEGYMWFGTSDGLCRYDGYRIVTFRANAENPGFLTRDDITCLAEDRHNRIWIGTSRGINVLDKKDYRILHPDMPEIRYEYIRVLHAASDGDVWVGAGNILLRYGPDMTLRKVYDSLPHTSVNFIYEDSSGTLWVGLWRNGLFRYEPERDEFVRMPRIGEGNNPFRMYRDNRGCYWICTWGNGLYIYDPGRNGTETLTEKPVFHEKKAQETTLFGIVQDDVHGYIWVLAYSGLHAFRYDENGKIEAVDVAPLFRDYNNIFSEIIKDRRGNLWIATFGEGVLNVDFNTPSIVNHNLPRIKELTGITANINCLFRDDEGDIWFNQNRWGMGIYNPDTDRLRFYPELLSEPLFTEVSCIGSFGACPGEVWVASLSGSRIHSLSKRRGKVEHNYTIDLTEYPYGGQGISGFWEDRAGNIRIATTDGLFLRDREGRVEPVDLLIGGITALAEDPDGNIWIGSRNSGLYCLTGGSPGSTVHYSRENSLLASNHIMALCGAPDGSLWIGTQEGYLIRYDSRSDSFDDRSASLPVAGEKIQNMLAGQYGHIWISTNRRVLEFDPATGALRQYSQEDGVLINSFHENSCYAGADGRIYYGGNRGISVFSPSGNLSGTGGRMRPIVSDFKINSRSVVHGSLRRNVDFTASRIVFEPGDRNIEIDLSTLNYSYPSKIRFAYKMSGIDKEWIHTQNDRRYAFYNRIGSGNHQFLLRAADANGLWEDEMVMWNIYKRPAFYESWWAFLVYGLLSFLAVYTAYLRAKRRIKLRNDLKIAQIEKDKSEELTQAKLRYFTNISHDFLTPLTIISCLIDDVETTSADRVPQFKTMRANINRLKRLLQQVLDFRKLESGNMKLKLSEGDIVDFIRNLCYAHFTPLMQKKDILFTFSSDRSIRTDFDADKIDKIFFNLLSNAFKYTPQGGRVRVSLKTEEQPGGMLLLTAEISDTGIGIEPDDLPKIFERFYNNGMAVSVDTNGIGLSLVKELLTLHGGTVGAESRPGAGSTFTVRLPVVDKRSSENGQTKESAVPAENVESQFQTPPAPAENPEYPETTVLLVEDNEELLSLVQNILSRHYRIRAASNGADALSLVRQENIDLVVSDIMMPGMDGLTFCSRLKNDIETSHIPVVLLTAKSDTEDRIASYNAGADGYISKPFDLKVLEARLQSLLLRREARQKAFKANPEINISTLEYTSQDETFLRDIVQEVENHLAESGLDVHLLAQRMNLSKSSLYRKVKAMTGLSPSEFIRTIRLKHAGQILLSGSPVTISEVAYAVGFSDSKYFATCFKVEFGVTPSEYQKTGRAAQPPE